MINLVKRNLLYTIRDKSAFLMSFLSVIILVFIYKSFLGNFQIDSIKSASNLSHINNVGKDMVNYWLISGLVIVTSVTSVVNGLGVVVDDYENNKFSDFKILGVSQYKVIISYYFSSIVIGFFVTFLSLLFSIWIFVGFNKLMYIPFKELSYIILVIFLSNIVASLFSMPFARLMKTRNSFAIFSTIVGTLIGFISGVYISIGNVSSFIKNIMLSLPFIHEVTLLKNNIMLKSENLFFKNFSEQARLNYDKLYGNKLYMSSENIINLKDSLLFIIFWILVLILVNIIVNFLASEKD